jgi:hypothetical protein
LRGDAPSGDMSEWNGDLTTVNNGNREQINITLDHLILSVLIPATQPPTTLAARPIRYLLLARLLSLLKSILHIHVNRNVL